MWDESTRQLFPQGLPPLECPKLHIDSYSLSHLSNPFLSPHGSQVLDLHCGLMALPAYSYFLPFIFTSISPNKLLTCLNLPWHLLLRGPELIQRPISNTWSFLSFEAQSCHWKSMQLASLFLWIKLWYSWIQSSFCQYNHIFWVIFFNLRKINLIVCGLSCSSQGTLY